MPDSTPTTPSSPTQKRPNGLNCYKTGKLVGDFGSYGNADCKGKGSAYPHPELLFGSISSLAVWKDKLFVMDVLNRRLVKCNITYDPALKSAK